MEVESRPVNSRLSLALWDGTGKNLLAEGLPLPAEEPETVLLKYPQEGSVAQTGRYLIRVTHRDNFEDNSACISYSLRWSDGTGTVAEEAPSITQQPEFATVDLGGTVSFNVNSTGTTPMTFQWLKNGVKLSNGGSIAGATTATLQLSSVSTADAGEYTAVVSNVAGSVASAAAALEVRSGNGTAGLVHRYMFDEGQGRTVEDSVSGKDGEVKGDGYSWGKGMLTLPGGPSVSAPYVDLPNGIISKLEDATFEAWVTVNEVRSWARIFDFGSTSVPGGELHGPGGSGTGVDFISLASATGFGIKFQSLQIAHSDSGHPPLIQNTPEQTTKVKEEFHVAVVFDSTVRKAIYYRDGEFVTDLDTRQIKLENINDVNNWLGRSNYDWDHNLQGAFNEFRIWDRALTPEQISRNFGDGPDGVNPPTVINPPQITTQPLQQIVTAGDTVIFSVEASGTGPLRYQWKHNGQDIANEIYASLQLSNVSTLNAGEYTVVVSNTGGDAGSQGASLTVQTVPSASCTPAPSGLVSWWQGDFNPRDISSIRPGTLHNGATFTSGKVGGGAFRFLGSGGFVSTELDVQPNAMPETTWEAWVKPLSLVGRQQILSTDDNGFDRSVLIEGDRFGVFTGNGVWSPVEATNETWQHIAVVFTQNDIHFYRNGEQFSYGSPPRGQETLQKLAFGARPVGDEFFNGAIDEISVYNRALSAGEIKAISEAGSAGKCLPGNNGGPPSISSIRDQSIEAGTSTGAITFTVNDAETAASDLAVTGSSSNMQLIPEASISLAGSGANRTVTITPSPGQFDTSTITLKVTDELGMSAETSFVLTVKSPTVVNPPQITEQPQQFQSVTAGDTVIFRVVTTGPGPLTYQWRHDGQAIAGATSASLQLSGVSTSDAGEYTVVVGNTGGQVESQGAVLTVRTQPSGVSFALRRLPSGYIGGSPVTVSIEAAPPNQALAYGLEDQPPAGWTISDIDSGGAHDTVSGKIKWTFLDNNSRTLTYRVTPPSGQSGVQCFSGIGNINGTDESTIGGDQCIELAQQHPADFDPSDWSLTLTEVLMYATAYKRGDVWSRDPNPIPLDYVIRALVLYKSGEQYRIDEAIGSAPGWWVNDIIRLASSAFSKATVLSVGSSAVSELPHEYASGVPFMVTILVTPAQGGVAYGVEDRPPDEWSVSAINESGEYDAVNHKVKWTFLDNQARSLSYEVTPPHDAAGSATFTGIVSFDGAENKTIEGDRSTTPTVQGAPEISIVIDANGNTMLIFDGALHSAADVAGPYAELPGAVSPLKLTPTSTSQFYKAVRP